MTLNIARRNPERYYSGPILALGHSLRRNHTMKPKRSAHFIVLLIALFSARSASAAKSYSYVRIGNANDITTTTTPGTVLMGGGTDVDAAFQWMC